MKIESAEINYYNRDEVKADIQRKLFSSSFSRNIDGIKTELLVIPYAFGSDILPNSISISNNVSREKLFV